MVDLNDSLQDAQEDAALQEARLFGYADLDTTQILRGLRHQFEQERHRIVFWNDPDREFTQVVGTLLLIRENKNAAAPSLPKPSDA